MIRLFKRLAILAGLWLGISVAGVVYVNTRTPEQFEADLRTVLEPTLGALDETLEAALTIGSVEFDPFPPDDVMRSETEAALAEVETLYDELIATHQAAQEAHADEWEKRWAGNAVTIARMDKKRALEDIRNAQRTAHDSGDMTPWAASHSLDMAWQTADTQRMIVEEELAFAREKLRAANDAP